MKYKEKYSELIKTEAKCLGFESCGISKARFLEEEAKNLESWLNNNLNAEMSYMSNNFDKRLDPTLLVDNAKSVISLAINYYPEKQQINDTFKISKYAYGEDYHLVVKDKLHKLFKYINDNITPISGRVFTDSAPVLEHAWAKLSGLGWIGKNSNLIIPKHGSYFFIAELIIDLELEYDTSINEMCGNCTKCIDSCPTEAIIKPYVVDSKKCISYLTIEYKGKLNETSNLSNNYIFGCDICLDVCPFNRFAKPNTEKKFQPNIDLLQLNKNDWQNLTKEKFNLLFKKSAIKRTKYHGLMRNIDFYKH